MKKLYILTLLLTLATVVMAQTPNIRYVKMATQGGAYANDGKSWANAKNNIQDAINDLVDNGLTGEVWVAAGTYTPTESTEQSGGSTLYMAFKIPAGITVRGGFKGDLTSSSDGKDDNTTRPKKSSNIFGNGCVYTNKTILSGRLASTPETFTFNKTKQQFDTKFYGNTYHVVWFAMKGFDSNGRANALTGGKAELEGCIVEGGHANNNDITGRKHNAYGGGIYMVDGAIVRNCEVRYCDASRDGGGVYMDGGGLLVRSFVHDCQALGVGTDNGFGGGVCLEGLSQTSKVMAVVSQSAVSNNVGRFGGGIAMKVNNTANRTCVAASTTLVNNNTSTTAGGGVMLYKGGALGDVSIVRNRCNGSGVITNGIQSGRAGGLFAFEKANVADCVIWGNECGANNNIQYASERSRNTNDLKVEMKFTSLSRADLCDWSGTVKQSVRQLHEQNSVSADPDPSMGYTLFKNPTTVAGNTANDGSTVTLAQMDWQPYAESALHHAGIQTIDLDKDGETESPAETYDVRNNRFNPRVTLGAYVSASANIQPVEVGDSINFYVDPNHVFAVHSDASKGVSWTSPTRFLGNVLELIAQDAEKETPVWNVEGKTINIFIKEGTIDNTDSYRTGRVRNMSLNVPSNVNIYGGYAASLKGVDKSVRNPRRYQTIISGDIMGDYETNVAHLVVLDGVSNVTIDGVQIREANASSTLLAAEGQDGAALTIKGSKDGINIKNVLIANNQANQGAAVLAENSTVSFENCIFHNNTSYRIEGIIASTGSSALTFNHCDVLRNVGYASWLDGTSSNVWNNSILYGNLDRYVDNTNVSTGDDHEYALVSFAGPNAQNVSGTNSMFDAKSVGFSGKFTGAHSKFNLSYNITHEDKYPRFINPTRNSGHSVGGDVTFYGRSTSFEPHNLNPAVNAASHSNGHETWGTDMSTVTTRDFGGLPDIGAIENHQDITDTFENAYREGQAAYGSIYYVRDYATTDGTTGVATYDGSGNHVAGGLGTYAADGHLFDGSSWEYAINGNASYGDRTLQLPTFTLSYDDNGTTKYLGYRVTTVDEVKDPETGETISEKQTTVHMNKHPMVTSWYSMETTTKENEAIHFQLVDGDRLTFTIGGKSYGLGTSTNGSRKRIGFIENYKGDDARFMIDAEGYIKVTRNNVWLDFENFATSTAAGYEHDHTVLLGAVTTNDKTQGVKFIQTFDTETISTKGLQWAVDNAKENNVKAVRVAAGTYTNHNERNPHSNDQAYAFMMEEGVDVFGGYPKFGNPGEEERQPKENITNLQIQDEVPTWRSESDMSDLLKDGTVEGDHKGHASVGRVLVQPEDFDVETKWDGFTIRNGFLHSWYRHNIRGNISTIRTNLIGTSGGAGVYLMGNGVLENCEVKNNVILVVPIYDQNDNHTGYQAVNSPTSDGGFHQAGAGVYMTGTDVLRGTVKNCDINNNQLIHKYWKRDNSGNPESSWMYGAGLYLDNGTVFNTVIHNNMMRVIKGNLGDNKEGTNQVNEVLVGAGAFLVRGEFYNNTVVNNEAHTYGRVHNRNIAMPGVYVYNNMAMYNSIVAGNNFSHHATSTGNTQKFGVPVCSFSNNDQYNYVPENVTVRYSFIDVNYEATENLCKNSDSNNTNIYLNRAQGGATASYSVADDNNNVYDDNYHLLALSPCFNAGTENIPNNVDDQEGAAPEGGGSGYSDWITIPTEDADYTFRVKDCRIDIGAFEFNGAVGIYPQLFAADGTEATDEKPAVQAVYYVTPDGYGTRAANDPANAACAQKLQKVIDAAGRYKYENPTVNVVVKVANSYAFENDSDPNSHFKYYATRSTNQADENVRVWSIIIPRGVEVWGGFTDVAADHTVENWSNNDNGFYRLATEADVTNKLASAVGEKIDLRDIIKNPTYFDSYYENKLEHTNANCYHVVTFSDRVFDAVGNPYMKRDLEGREVIDHLAVIHSTYDPLQDEKEDLFVHMSDVVNTNTAGITNLNQHRAVLDGIFVTGGKADAMSAGRTTTQNINLYGGAAIVTPYAHVRNCILRDNRATNGGALALMDRALVSGSIFMDNNASGNGGALYVFEDGTQLSDGTTVSSSNPNADVNHTATEYGKLMDTNMAHVFTSSIVKNTAGVGGGVWFTDDNEPNVRFNSVAIWANTATDEANVAGMTSPEKPTTDHHSSEEFYPFAYSAVESMRLPGSYNFSVDPINHKGIRFANEASDLAGNPVIQDVTGETNNFANISRYLGPIEYSTLVHSGISALDYTQLAQYLALSETDVAGVSRTVNTSDVPRTYIEVGARAIDKMFSRTQPMYRLFVAKAEDVNLAAAKALKDAGRANDATDIQKYYGQEGSSFAFPFQSMQDALDYIHLMRFRGNIEGEATYDSNGKLTNELADGNLLKQYHANNLPFEIFVSRGTYHPKRDLVSNTDHALSATFAIPEGVSVYGGFLCTVARNEDNVPQANTFYGKGFSAVDYDKAAAMTTPEENPTVGLNGNNIYNNVTPVAGNGNVISIGGTDYRIMEVSADKAAARRNNHDLNANSIVEPWEFEYQTILSGDAGGDANNGLYHIVTVVPDENIVGVLPVANEMYNKNSVDPVDDGYAMHTHMRGQTINLDGLQIQGGYAFHYVPSAFDDDPTSDYNYYHGGGLLVDGNRYCDTYYGKSPIVNNNVKKVGEIQYKHLQRTNAIGYRDVPVNIKNCKFLDNRGGFGGAISTNTTMNIFQSAFEQNQAVGMTEHFVHDTHGDTEVHYPGNGGAIHATHILSAFNTLFANNEAKNEGTPAYGVEGYKIEPQYFHTLRNEREGHTDQGLKILGGAGGAISMGKASVFHIMNCDFVKNKANMYPAVFTMNPNVRKADDTNLRDYNQFANTVFWGNEVNENMLTKHKDNAKFMFASKLFCNYRYDAGSASGDYNPHFDYAPADQAALDAVDSSKKPYYAETAWFSAYEVGMGKSVNHDVDMRAAQFDPRTHLDANFTTSAGVKQNCNVIIASENSVLEGPNFVNPSHFAGVAGYMESADWSPARINNLTDNGSGKIKQIITNSGGKDYACSFVTYSTSGDVPDRSVNKSSGGFTNETTGDFNTDGIYGTARYLANEPEYRENIALGSDRPYMKYVQNDAHIYRISYDPNPSHDQTYVDIGVYEYVHTQLKPNEGDEVDILWVSTDEKPENGVADGSEWSQPTSDLQRAIETLLASRNGHRKEIRLMDGTFTPIYTIEGNLSFYIDTYKLNGNVILPENASSKPVTDLNVKSLTIKGGYSKDLENEYDVEKYPAIIKGQQRTNENADNWNHAFYIKDATQRYGIVSTGSESIYTSDNKYGADPNKELGDGKVQTIPIEIDGVTFINDQAKTTDANGDQVEGAALYYESQVRTIGDDTYTTKGTTAAGMNYEVIQYYTDPEHQHPSTNNAPTLYASYKSVPIPAENTPALILSKCKFYASGDRNKTKNTSAVYVGTKGAISTLIYNNVFHSNYGNPLVAYNAKTINNTYGLNGGYINLLNDGGASTILNSAMWKNNETVSGQYGKQADIAGTAFGPGYALPAAGSTIFNYNALTLSAVTEPNDGNSHNASLANDNTDLFDGPNFIDPENPVVEKRNYNILPSFRLLNQGSNNNYKTNVVVDKSANPVVYDATGNIIEYAWDPTTEKDAALNTRIYDTTIDVGAYEYQNQLQRIFYVDPNKVTTDNNDGKKWETAMGRGQIQDAINSAGLYHHAHDTEHDKQEAYVYVRGASATNKGMHTGETLNLRDGVKVFGSLPASYMDECEYDEDSEHKPLQPNNTQATAYENKVIADRHGLAAPNGNKTTIAGIKTDEATKFNSPTVVDGFDVTAQTEENPTGAISAPVIDVDPKSTGGGVQPFAIRNVIVHDNTAAENGDIVKVNNALIYEVLMRDNNVSGTGSVMHLGANGYAVNVTVEGKSTYEANSAKNVAPLNGVTDEDTKACRMYNSLVNYGEDASTKNTLSGYNYELEDKNLNYQLAERSKHIDGCATPAEVADKTLSPLNGVVDNLAGFIDYRYDRDLLGNPRMMKLGSEATNLIDRGAFETWKVDVEAVTTDAGVADDATKDHNGWSGTHYYPHDGSVVYIMEGNNLVSNHDMTPGFLLVQKGASLYGQGKAVNAAYVAVERDIRKNGSIVALPYAMKYNSNDAAAPAYDGETGVLTLTKATANAYNYSGSERSAWDYIFKTGNTTPENSTCWHSITEGVASAANNGVLYEANDVPDAGKLVRFTGKGANMADYIYTEAGVSKTVTLTQYDDDESTNHGADFTNKLDMGWNCFGIPYLVSEYKPYEKVTANAGANTVEKNASGEYSMSRAHTLWLYYDGVHTPDTKPEAEKLVDGDGGYYSVKSWESSNATTDAEFADGDHTNPWHVTSLNQQTIWVGEGIFTQTAAIDDTESLVFYRPIYTASPTPGGGAKAVRYYGSPTGIEEVTEDVNTDNVELVGTEYYTTDGMQLREPRRGSIVIIKRIYSNGAVKATKQYVK